jgi:hypothetical protein
MKRKNIYYVPQNGCVGWGDVDDDISTGFASILPLGPFGVAKKS